MRSRSVATRHFTCLVPDFFVILVITNMAKTKIKLHDGQFIQILP